MSAGVALAVAVGIGVPYIPSPAIQSAVGVFSRRRLVTQGALLGLGLLAVGALGPEGVAPIIYFQF